ncbi:uncharacterized protein LOC114118964 [Aphis gossypii]|uniref:ACYPI002609 protein n=1 Tax=Aphis gossypii TaxID=80765 RepID=A0A9P0J0N3_APHGO|nr:uncharacterized protein LOC114118964 [Aphis gossypii]XP_050055073.1 uncharacterized protein LOC114118964 [Aphis gossypii]CAH1724401.1 unnamed protein product [Aphis gossypii]
MLKQHLDMIGRNEPIQRKAKFWQSYVRALKGSDDMRAPEITHYHTPGSRGVFRPILSADYPTWPSYKSIYDDPVHPTDRINTPGYRYLPISRDTYGISPRNIYPHNYHSDRYPTYDPYHTEPFKALNDWTDHLDRMAELNKIFPGDHPAYYEPKKPLPLPERRATSLPPIKGYNFSGLPIYSTGGVKRRPLSELFEPSVYTPRSRYVRDPWWWEYPHLKPFTPSSSSYRPPAKSYLRNSYLSPVKRTYLWGHHPIRPFTPSYYY